MSDETSLSASADVAAPATSADDTDAAPAFEADTGAGDDAYADALAGIESDASVVFDDLGDMSFADAVDATIVEFEEGDIVSGIVVQVDKDEVLLDIGFKSEGVIPSKELSIRHDVDPSEVVSIGDPVEALVLQKEDADGRLILSKKRAQYERAWGTIEEIKTKEGCLLYTSPSPRDRQKSRMPSSA